MIIAVDGGAKAAFAVKTGVAENGCCSSDMFVAGLHGKADGNSSAKDSLNKGSAKIREEKAFKEAVAICVPV